jgi:hypothetical protein
MEMIWHESERDEFYMSLFEDFIYFNLVNVERAFLDEALGIQRDVIYLDGGLEVGE